MANGTYLIFSFFLFSAGLVARSLFHVGLLKKKKGKSVNMTSSSTWMIKSKQG
jgi:hypothetical protein